MFSFKKKRNGSVQNVTFLGGAGLIDTNEKDDLYDEVMIIAEELAKMYPKNCHACGNAPCTCNYAIIKNYNAY